MGKINPIKDAACQEFPADRYLVNSIKGKFGVNDGVFCSADVSKPFKGVYSCGLFPSGRVW